MVDSRKRLYDACRLARNYPENLQRSKAFPHALEKYHNRLEETKEKLFDAKFTQIDLLESQDAGDGEASFDASYLAANIKANSGVQSFYTPAAAPWTT